MSWLAWGHAAPSVAEVGWNPSVPVESGLPFPFPNMPQFFPVMLTAGDRLSVFLWNGQFSGSSVFLYEPRMGLSPHNLSLLKKTYILWAARKTWHSLPEAFWISWRWIQTVRTDLFLKRKRMARAQFWGHLFPGPLGSRCADDHLYRCTYHSTTLYPHWFGVMYNFQLRAIFVN